LTPRRLQAALDAANEYTASTLNSPTAPRWQRLASAAGVDFLPPDALNPVPLVCELLGLATGCENPEVWGTHWAQEVLVAAGANVVAANAPKLQFMHASLPKGGETQMVAGESLEQLSRFGPIFDAGRHLAFDLPSFESFTDAHNPFFRPKVREGITYFAAKTPSDPTGNNHTAVLKQGKWHTAGQVTNQLSVIDSPDWIGLLSQLLVDQKPAFVVTHDQYGKQIVSRVTAANFTQSTITLEQSLRIEADLPRDFFLAYAQPDDLVFTDESTTITALGTSTTNHENWLRALSPLLVDNPDLNGDGNNNDPYVVQNVLDQMRRVLDAVTPSGAKVATIYYNDPRTWDRPEINVRYGTLVYGHFTAEIAPPPQTIELPQQLVTPVKDALAGLSDFSMELGNQSQMTQPIPGANKTLGEVASPGDSLQGGLLTPVNDYFASTTNPTVDGLLGATGGRTTADAFSSTNFRQEGSAMYFDIDFIDRKSFPLPFDFGLSPDSLPFDLSLDVNLIGEFHLDVTLGIDLAQLDAGKIDEAVFFQVRDLSVRAIVETYELDAALKLGFLEVGIENGRIVLEAKLSAQITDFNGDGRISLGEIRSHSFSDLADVSFTSSLAADLPIAASLGSFSTSTITPPRIVVSDADLFSAPLPALSFVDFDQIADFMSFDTASILALLRAVSDRLQSMGETSGFNFKIPFTNTRLGDALDMGLDFVDELTGVGGAQSLATKLTQLLGLDVEPQYNPVTRELTFRIDYNKSLDVGKPFAFDADLAPIADISATGNIALAGNLDVGLTFGIDVSPVSAAIFATGDAPANGNFAGEAVFQLQVGSADPVEVRLFGTGNATLDDLIADINAALAAKALAVSAERDGNRIRLRTTSFTATPTLRVTASAGNPAVTALRLPTAADAFDSIGNHVFIRDAGIDASLALGGDLSASATFGFVDITGTLSAEGDLGFSFSPGGGARLGVAELFDILSTNPASLGTPTLTGSAAFHVGNVAAVAAGIDLGIIPGGSEQISVLVPDYLGSAPQIVVNPALLAGLDSFKEMDFDTILNALTKLAEVLEGMANNGLMGGEIPIIGVSAGDFFGFATDFLQFVQKMREPQNRARSLADLEDKLQAGLNEVLAGAAPTIHIGFANTILTLALDFNRTANSTLDLNLDFDTLGPVANLPVGGSLVEVSSTETISLQGGLTYHLAAGIDLTTPTDPLPFIGRSSTFGVNAKIASPPLNLDVTALGVLPLFVRNGTIALDQMGASTNPAAFTIGFLPGNERIYLSNIASVLGQLNLDLNGALNVTLPLNFPNPTTPIGNLAVQVPDLERLLNELRAGSLTPGTVSVTSPDLNALINSVDLLTVLRGLSDQFDFLFEKINGTLDTAFDFELPLVGISLNDVPAIGFIDNLIAAGTQALSGVLAGTFTFDTVRDAIDNRLKSTFPGASVIVTKVQTAQEVRYRVQVADSITQNLSLDADLGLPALGFDVDADLSLDLDWAIDFTMGANRTQGVFFDVATSPELSIDLNVSLAPGSALEGSLGFLDLSITDDAASPTLLSGSIDVNVIDPGANDNRVTMSELADVGVVALDELVDVNIAGIAAAHLDFALSSQYDLSDILGFLPAVSLPRILADLDATWSLGQSAPTSICFTNVRMDLGDFFAGFGGKSLDALNAAVEPIRPVLDILTRRLPVLSDIGPAVSALDRDGDGNVTLLDAAAMLGGVRDTRMIAGLSYVVDLLDSVRAVNSAAGSGAFLIPLGNLCLTGQDLSNPNGLANYHIPASVETNFNLTTAINSVSAQPNGAAVASAANQFVQKTNQTPNGLSLSLPILKKPSSIMGVLLGRDVDLLKLDLPPIDVGFSI
jgi:hypothetical protein